ncbi:MAG: T9SS type A sorting domain-containing protein, partial [Candidatus Marinimicrobia bacterium]|nr:T9SS type A sorting domain-containing protein [Candidatus Neomarinimicrobiota bacterium]
GGFNHFYQNSGVAVYRNGSGVPVWADPPSPLSQSALYGQVNYWYANLMDVTEPGTDQVYGSLNWNPTAGMLIAGDDGNYDEFELLHNGLKSEQLADYQTAIDYYQQFLDTKPKFDLAIVAMSGQDRCYSQLKAIDQWQVKLEDISQNFDDEQQKELAKNYLIWVYKKQQMDQEAIAMAEQLIDASAGTEYADYYALEIALLADETDGAILAKSLPSQKGMVARIQTAQNHLLAADNFSDAARFYKLISGSPASQSMNHALPQSYALHPAYPNPFNPVTTIRYDLPEASQVQLVIYDIQGREVTRLINATREAGTYTTQWQGRDNSGRMVASGLYFYTLEALAVDSGERFRASRKFLLLK